MRVLITAGPTQEPIDAVRYIGNRSSGKMGAALAAAARRGGHAVTLILGPVTIAFPHDLPRIDVITSRQMLDAVLEQFPRHDLLIMAAAVSDFRPTSTEARKLPRQGTRVLELEATADILAEVGKIKRADQRTIGFSLEAEADLDRARRKLVDKRLDLSVYNPTETIGSDTIAATLLWADGRTENLALGSKSDISEILLHRAAALFQSHQ
jgi:phosphopantothenoylcysteine decarboxylase / phosphopantothenate---cysteine ligase